MNLRSFKLLISTSAVLPTGPRGFLAHLNHDSPEPVLFPVLLQHVVVSELQKPLCMEGCGTEDAEQAPPKV